jgi:hypothetical protein
MGEVVNLRRARKLKAREAAAAEAADRRAAFGVSKAARGTARSERELVERRWAAHRLDEASTGRAEDGE